MQQNGAHGRQWLPDPLKGLDVSHEYAKTSFLDPSTPGLSDGDWRGMSGMQNGQFANSAFSPSVTSIGSPDPTQPLTPKIDSFTDSDVIAKHLLVETALLDSSRFDILSIDEVDQLKKEKEKVESRIESARRKLALESKVRDAAQSLQRLYSTKGRKDGAARNRKSWLGDRRASGSSVSSDSLSQAGDELAQSNKKVDELVQMLIGLENRRQYLESRLLRHTAAVLQAAHADRENQGQGDAKSNGAGLGLDYGMPFNESSLRGKDDLDSLYEELDQVGALRLGSKKDGFGRSSQDARLEDVNMRIQHLNGQLRSVIHRSRRSRSKSVDSTPDDIPSAYPEDDDAATRLDSQLEHMQASVLSLVQEHKTLNESREQLMNETKHNQHATEGRLESINNQLFNLISTSADGQNSFDSKPPPQITGHSSQEQIGYLEENFLTIEQMMQQSEHIQDSHNYLSKELEDLRVKATNDGEKSNQYETVLLGLWEILCSRNLTDNDDKDEQRDVKEPFSIQAFNARVQYLFEHASNLDTQTEVLRRQIQQQRELADKPDANHVRELEECKNREQEALHELDEHRSRAEALRDHVADLEATLSEHQDDARIGAAEAQAREQDHNARVAELSATLATAHAAKEAAEAKNAEMESLESEVVRLTTELTMAKAELDGAYGSRAQRAKEVTQNPEYLAQMSRLEELDETNRGLTAELEQMKSEKHENSVEMAGLMTQHAKLSDRHKDLESQIATLREVQNSTTSSDGRMRMLEKELADMVADYQDLTRETVEVEKEREEMEGLVDALRERIEGLEAQLSDEKVKWLGLQTPSGTPDLGQRQMTSTMVLRNEFKKMMRETRAEGVRLLRAEQEEKRKLEAALRSIRKEKNGGLSPSLRP
ncbi:hypothetical protein MBLNU459_g4147t1 [Dothideomycetes sp. NU459]